MKIKIVTFLYIIFFIIGCGVMNNPDSNGVPKGSIDIGDESFLIVSKIYTDSLIVSDLNREFITTQENNSYRLFESLVQTEEFLTDLNSSSQTLISEDLDIVQSWIKSIEGANINYDKKNLLFYPILQNQNCGIKNSTHVDENSVTILIENSRNECDDASVYHVLLYEVDKSIENIKIKAFDNNEVIIFNKK